MNVLIADPAEATRNIIRAVLRELEVEEVSQAIDGENALKILAEAENTIDLIIADWDLPKLSGIEFLKKVKASAEYKGIPFIIAITDADSIKIMQAIKEKVDQCLVKPFTANQLIEKIKSVIKKS